MTTTTGTEATLRYDLRRRAWISAGAALLACSAALTWALGGTWLALGLLGLISGAGMAISARRSWRDERADAGPETERDRTPGGAGSGSPAAPTDLLVRAVRHDLPMMVGLCRRLPSGGLPQAGMLAEHTYVTADALRQILARDTAPGPASLELELAAVAAQLDEVDRRAARLYSAERPGGLDHLDWHLARLWVVAEEYLAGQEPGTGASPSWSRSLSHRRRARILAWSATATDIPLALLRRGQAMRTRAWLRSGTAWRARRRARLLWGPTPSGVVATRSSPGWVAVPAREGRGAA